MWLLKNHTVRGNTSNRQRSSGHLAGRMARARAQNRESTVAKYGPKPVCKPLKEGVYYEPAFKPRYLREGNRNTCQGQNRISGNPTVRDRRGARGNVAMRSGSTASAERQGETSSDVSKVRAPRIYPDPDPSYPLGLLMCSIYNSRQLS